MFAKHAQQVKPCISYGTNSPIDKTSKQERRCFHCDSRMHLFKHCPHRQKGTVNRFVDRSVTKPQSSAVVKVRGGQGGLSPTCCRLGPPDKISALAAKNLAWPALHESRCFICLLLSKYIVTVIVNVVHTPSLHHRLSLWCKVGVRTVT